MTSPRPRTSKRGNRSTTKAKERKTRSKHAKISKSKRARATPLDEEGYDALMDTLRRLYANPSSLSDLSSVTVRNTAMNLDDAVKVVRRAFRKQFKFGDVDGVVRGVVHCKDKSELVDALILASASNVERLIFEEGGVEHYTSTQTGTDGKAYVCQSDQDCSPVHILNWVVMTAPPLAFCVPMACSAKGADATYASPAETRREGIRFYKELNSRLVLVKPDVRDDILYRHVPSGLQPELDRIAKKAKTCKRHLSKRPASSLTKDVVRGSVTDCAYGHAYLSANNLIRTLSYKDKEKGGDDASKLHWELLRDVVQSAESNIEMKLQLFTRLKLAEHAMTRGSKECQFVGLDE